MKTTKTMWMISRQALLTGFAVALIAAQAGTGPQTAQASGGNNKLLASADLPIMPVSTATPVAPDAPQKIDVTEPRTLDAPQPAANTPLRSSAIQDHGTSVSLDFVDASIVDVLKALSLQSGYNIVASPDVASKKVTVSLAHVSLEAALDFITKPSDLLWLRQGNTYIVGSELSLKQFLPAPSAGNAITTRPIRFTYSEQKSLVDAIVSAFKNDDVTISLVTPYVSTSSEYRTTFSQTASPSGSANGQTAVGKAEGARGGVIMVTGKTAVIDRVKEFVDKVEDSFNSISLPPPHIYTIRYAFGPHLASILASLIPGLTVIAGPSQEFDSGGKLSFSTGVVTSDRFTATTTGASVTGGAGNTGNAAAGSGQTSASGTSSSSSQTSTSTMSAPKTLILSGSQSDIDSGLKLLAQIDVKPAQILFEVKVEDFADTDETALGINWDFSGAQVSYGGSGTAAAFTFGTLGAATSDIVTATGNAKTTKSHAKTLANPKIAALDGQRAVVFIGDTDTYVSTYTNNSSGTSVTTASVNAGVTLAMTGRVTDDGFVNVYLHPEISSVTFTTQDGSQLPDVSTEYADTIIRVKNGDTIAIGGLTKEQVTKSGQKVPILGDLPILKALFNNADDLKSKHTVVFFIKTTILSDHA
ncbi:MAG: hypothetical protein P4L33_19200 [Capsulimonadaceae bacterium]|nr:hypothetical protein [Capsulimonadaceae bacterium]